MPQPKTISPEAGLRFRTRVLEEQRRDEQDAVDTLGSYAYDPLAYIREKLLWEPWGSGDLDNPGQIEIVEEYARLVRTQIEKRDFELGKLANSQLEYYTPGDTVQYVLRIPKGYNTGGTRVASGLVNHFYDCFVPSIVYCLAPSFEQIKDLLWKEVRTTRRGKGLPGRMLERQLIRSDDHFVKIRATDNMKGTGQERLQGQHQEFLMFVLDEAEGIPDFVYEAVDRMGSSAGGGIVIVIMLANPRTPTSRFHKMQFRPFVRTLRLSCLNHPNVRLGKPVIPASVSRDWVRGKIAGEGSWCEVVRQHDDAARTFEVDWLPGQIFKPNDEFLYSVLGITPEDATGDTVVPVGVYEAALKRWKLERKRTEVGYPLHGRMVNSIYSPLRTHIPGSANQPYQDAWIGVDVARFGTDKGTIYIRWNGLLWRHKVLYKRRTSEYFAGIKSGIEWLVKAGARRVRLRVDGTGGFASGVVDSVHDSLEIEQLFTPIGYSLVVSEIHFGGRAHDSRKYVDIITQMYFEAAESLRGCMVVHPPEELKEDLTERKFHYKNVKGRQKIRLEEKEDFRKRTQRSPDDGDGAALCLVPDYVIGDLPTERQVHIGGER